MASSALRAVYLQFTEESDERTFIGSLENFLSVSSHSPIKLPVFLEEKYTSWFLQQCACLNHNVTSGILNFS